MVLPGGVQASLAVSYRRLAGSLPRMVEAPDDDEFEAPPDVDAHATVDELVVKAVRKELPLRREFLQLTDAAGKVTPGPMAGLVSAGDKRGLVLYLLLATKASAGDYGSGLAAAVWARALGLWNPTGKTATSAVSKTWLRLESRHLIARERRKRRAHVTMLREDGSGAPYVHPGTAREVHFKVPHALWTAGPDAEHRWYEVLSLPELAVLLIARSLGDRFRLPIESANAWYGISADTATRGLHGLVTHGLLEVRTIYKPAPLSPLGYTEERRYTLQPPFGPIGVRSRRRTDP